MKSASFFALLHLWTLLLGTQFASAENKSYVPQVADVVGGAYFEIGDGNGSNTARVGNLVPTPTTFHTLASSEIIFSLPGRIVVRMNENSTLVVGPAVNHRYEVRLIRGTVTALLDPERDREKEPSFAVRGSGGVTEATGTLYAVTEYKGQTYASVKKGKVVKKATPPNKPDFSAYLKKAKSKSTTTKTNKTD